MESKEWLDRKHVEATGRPIGLFYDNPLETPAVEPRSEACLPISEAVQAEGRFKIKDLPAVKQQRPRTKDPQKNTRKPMEHSLREFCKPDTSLTVRHAKSSPNPVLISDPEKDLSSSNSSRNQIHQGKPMDYACP